MTATLTVNLLKDPLDQDDHDTQSHNGTENNPADDTLDEVEDTEDQVFQGVQQINQLGSAQVAALIVEMGNDIGGEIVGDIT